MDKITRPSKSRQTLGKKAFVAISAVEGLKLSQAGVARLREFEVANLSFEERRAEVVRAYTSISRRK